MEDGRSSVKPSEVWTSLSVLALFWTSLSGRGRRMHLGDTGILDEKSGGCIEAWWNI